jgi:hypothetical protein
VGIRRLEQAIPSLLRTTPALKAAMEQVAEYCQQRGVPYAAVTNGHQIVAFMASRSDGLAPFEGTAAVFTSMQHMRDSFLDLWNLLSKPALEQQTLRTRLVGETKASLPPKLSTTIRSYPGTKGRNPFQSSMKTVSEFILEDVARAKEMERTFLKVCYCYSGALSDYSLMSRQMLMARYAALFDSERPGPSTSPVTTPEGINPELLTQSFSRRPILLIGDVGVGKTTFIRHLIANDPIFTEKAIPLYIDFGVKGTLADDLRSYILSEIDVQLSRDHGIDVQESDFARRVHAYDLTRFASGVNKPLKEKKPGLYQQKEIELLERLIADREEHLRLSLDVISHEVKKQIVVFLDNTDQRSEQDQQAAFLIAQEMADRWQAVIYVTLRPETYHASMRRGALTGYHPKAFTIAPPQVERVIQKRLIFGLRVTSGRLPKMAVVRAAQMDFGSLEILLRVFLRSIRERDEILTCVDNISAGNVRLALELVRSFFGSGHVDTQKIINIVKEQGGYSVPLHEFQRAIIFGDNVYYDPSRSRVANVFDLSTPDMKEHFLQPLLLAYLRLPGIDRSDEGFTPIRSLYDYFQGLGFTPEQLDVAVVRAYNKRLVETAARRIPQVGATDSHALRITSVGLYHIEDLVQTFTYLDAVLIDTPILDKSLRQLIVDVHSLSERLERAIIFCNYLERCWGALKGSNLPFDWPDKAAKAKALMGRINLRVNPPETLRLDL